MKGHAEETKHGKVKPFAFFGQGKLLSSGNHNTKDDRTHPKTDPHNGGRGDFT